MKSKTLLMLLLLNSLTGLAQPIGEIKMEGLMRTKKSYIKQFILTKTGGTYDSLKVEQDRQRVANLEIMKSVQIEKSVQHDSVTLTFRCTEMINTIPIFGLGQTRETFWCRAGIQDANLGGRGGKLIAYYQYYDRHSAFISFAQQRVRSKRAGFSATLIRWATIEPLTINQTVSEYNYDNWSGGASAIVNFGFRESVEIGFLGFKEDYWRREFTSEPAAPKRLSREGGLMKVIFRSNRINFSSFYLQGFSSQLNFELIKRTGDASLFHIIFNDFKYFLRVGKAGNLATRLRLGLSTNEPSPFAPFVLDSYLNIRGVGNRVDRGTGSIVANAEYRQTFFDKKLFAAQAVAFLDFGTWRKPGGQLADFSQSGNMKAFSGLGLRLIYKRAFDTLLRVDYGFDYSGAGGLVLGIGQYF